MSSDVELLARSVERVSINRSSRKKPFTTPSFAGEIEDAASIGSDGDVDMSDAPYTPEAPATLLAKHQSTEIEDSSHLMSTPNNESVPPDVSTRSCHTSPVPLRRGGRPSYALSKELIDMFQTLIIPSLCFFFSYAPGFIFQGSTGSTLRTIGKVYCVTIPITQVLRIMALSYSLFRTFSHRAIYKDTLSRRQRVSRAIGTSSRWNISALDRIDNLVCKVLVWLLLVVCRICIILLCCAFVGFSSLEDVAINAFIATGIENLDFLARTVFDFGNPGSLNTGIDANVLQECKTVPQLVFENQYMCT